MTDNTSDPVQNIAASAAMAFAGSKGKLLLYSEAEFGAISGDLFFQSEPSGNVQFRFAGPELLELIHGFWEHGHAHVTPKSWATMQLVISNGRFTIDFLYPDQFNQDEDLSDRRPRILSAHFPGASVDYSLARQRV